MIWRIVGTLGGASFLISGIAVLSDPNCLSADMGGGRVLTVTCRADSYGAMSAGAAGSFMLLIGMAILAFIYLPRFISRNANGQLSKKSYVTPTVAELKIGKKVTSVKFCDKCNAEVPITSSFCMNCSGTTFSHKLKTVEVAPPTSEEALLAQFPPAEIKSESISAKKCEGCLQILPISQTECTNCSGTSFLHVKVSASDLQSKVHSSNLSQTKLCPMCAEEIKFAAKKCRYCHHMMEE
jgi:ribosomal protein L40E